MSNNRPMEPKKVEKNHRGLLTLHNFMFNTVDLWFGFAFKNVLNTKLKVQNGWTVENLKDVHESRQNHVYRILTFTNQKRNINLIILINFCLI
jgi:hypothetical protein